MNIKLFFLVQMVFCCSGLQASPTGINPKEAKTSKKIVIQFQQLCFRPSKSPTDQEKLALRFMPLDDVAVKHFEWQTNQGRSDKEDIKWVLYSDRPLLLYSDLMGFGMVVPGDSINICYTDQGKIYSGKGFSKLKLQADLEADMKRFKKPTKYAASIQSLQEYRQWNIHLNKQLSSALAIINAARSRISDFEYNYIKSTTIRSIETNRAIAFYALFKLTYSETSGISSADLCHIFDSTLFNPQARFLQAEVTGRGDLIYYYNFIRSEVLRRFDFKADHDSINSDGKRWTLYYTIAKQNYKGLLRQRLMTFFIVDKAITLDPKDPARKYMVNDYYRQSGFADYKKWVSNYQKKLNGLRDGKYAPDFTLAGPDGKVFTTDDLKGKISLMDFWFTGCVGCLQMTPVLDKVAKAFANDPNIVFVSVSTDENKNKWQKSVDLGKYTTENAINLYTEGKGKEHSMINTYGISSYPELFLFDDQGRIVKHPLADPRKDNGESLITLMRKMRSELEDGPYVLYKDDSVFLHTVSPVSGKRQLNSEGIRIESGKPISLTVATDKYPTRFSVSLKKELNTEPATYDNVSKQFAVSDIEGNFDTFRKLLQSNGIIDEQFNWTFKDGHLVLVGDFFDRGKQVNEVLWLIYSLEEKAKQAGGYVHFILGNHEIMNLTNNIRYTDRKYKDNAFLIGMKYSDLYGNNSELGRWLRTKNIVERVGDVLYVHGGISNEVNDLALDINGLNNLSRPYYAAAIDSSNKKLHALFNSKTSPFWLREYYNNDNDELVKKQIDNTLQKFGVNRIVTGHTIVSDSITISYDKKVINIDTDHALGKSEGLLIEKNRYYRANTQGKKELLWDSAPVLIATMNDE